ncbi:MAG: anthranilate synthase component II [Cyclobacteriaceae bacterium]
MDRILTALILLIDNFDSFTYNLVDYFTQLGIKVHVAQNNVPLNDITNETYKAVVLSPGPETPLKAGNLMAIIDHYVDKLPILGICLGHQALAAYFGAEIIKAIKPMHGKISKINCKNIGIFKELPKIIEVVRYHSLVCSNMPNCLEVIAETDEKEIMAFRHILLPIEGLQFHPEALLTEHGLQMLYNWMICHKMQNG